MTTTKALAFFRGIVRPLATLVLVVILAAGFWIGKVSADQFLPIVTIVIGFWFGERTKSGKES